jgi:hypothetical protein
MCDMATGRTGCCVFWEEMEAFLKIFRSDHDFNRINPKKRFRDSHGLEKE